MKNTLFWMIALLGAISFSIKCNGQQVSVIEWDYRTLYKQTSSPDLGNLMPINECQGMINFGFAKIALINYENGKILSFFNEKKLKQKFINLLSTQYGNTYSLYSLEELNQLPYCQRQPFIYQRFYEIKKGEIYATEVSCTVKNNRTNLDEEIRIILFIDKQLKLLSIHEREIYNNNLLNSVKGGFFIGRDNFFIKRKTSKTSTEPSFAHFKLEEDTYRVEPDLQIIKSGGITCYFPGRHFSIINLDTAYIIHNETHALKTDNILTPTVIDTLKVDLKSNEVITTLRHLKNKKITGLKNDIDENGVSINATVFIKENNSSKISLKKSYDQRFITINSFEVYENNIVLLLFDRIKKKYLIEILPIK